METRKGRRIALASVAGVVVVLIGTVGWIGQDRIRSMIEFMRDFESLGKNAQGYAQYRHRQTSIVFVSLPGGTFLMGSPMDEYGRQPDEGPVHRVTLSPFLMAKYETTQAEWEEVMGTNPSYEKGEDLPVAMVSWGDCREFCERAGFSLPTEAQWEFACRAGTNTPFPGSGNPDEMGWHEQNSPFTTHSVGQKEPNDFGLHDLHGNLWEWCADWYQADFYSESTGAIDLACENSGSEVRVLRGGSWSDVAKSCRSAFRYWLHPKRRHSYIGFRAVARRP